MSAETWQIGQIVVVLGALLAMFLYIRHRPPARETVSKEERMANTMADLSATINTLRRQLDAADKRIQALEAENQAVKAENQSLATRIEKLEAQVRTPVAAPAVLPFKPLLVISGGDGTIFERDRVALRRADLPFHRLAGATQPSIMAELRRRRQDGSLYPWLLVSAHAGPAGIQLVDGIAPPIFWHNVLDGVQVVVLAVCAAAPVADELAGLVQTVIWFAESVPNEDAADFNYAFWRRLKAGVPAAAAYAEALREVPSVAEYVDMRSS